ncbi:MAG: MFS transporter [Firmicutes bacterium]|nr:MFS transporter [Bacillota bacterium]MCL5039196.1 MFS transporter [Bacillota bacterium]
MKARTQLEFAVLAAVPFIMVLGNSMLIPVLPEMKTRLQLTPFQVGLIITAFSLPAGLVIPWAGFLSDRIGRKKVMAPALVVYGVGGLVAGAAALLYQQAYLPILVGRIIQGIGAGGTYQLAMALTGDIFQSRERTLALGLLESSNGMGKVISPIAGAAAALLAWYAPFFLYGTLAIPIALLLWFLVSEPARQARPPALRHYFTLLGGVCRAKGLSLVSVFLSGLTVLFVLFGVLSYFTDVLEEGYGVRGMLKGLVIAGPILVMALTSYLAGTYLQNKSSGTIKTAIWLGLALMAGGLGLQPLLRHLYLSYLLVGVMGLGAGLVLPSLNTLITGSVAREERGLVTALYGTVRFFGAALGPPAFGLALALGERKMLLGGASLAGLMAILTLLLLNPQRLLEKTTGGGTPLATSRTGGLASVQGTPVQGRGSAPGPLKGIARGGESQETGQDRPGAASPRRRALETLPVTELSQELTILSQEVASRARKRLEEVQVTQASRWSNPAATPLQGRPGPDRQERSED